MLHHVSGHQIYAAAACVVFLMAGNLRSEDADPFLDPLPEMDVALVEKEMPPASLVLREAYGTGDGKVQVSEIFGVPNLGTLEVSGEELIITNHTGTGGSVNLNIKDFPVTIDIRLRMDIQSDGYVCLAAYTPYADGSKRGRVSQIFFRANSVANPPTQTSVAYRDFREPTLMRIVFDSEGKGRLYFVDGSGRSLPVGGTETQTSYKAIDLGVLNATVAIEQVAVYSETP